MKRLGALVALLGALLAGAAGCATVRPWERENLARREMRVGGDPDDEAHLDHTFAARESAMPAGTSTGGGCGCN